jgi:dipeptidase E
MKLMLSGGGAGEQTKKLDEHFASWVDKEKPLLYIPIAINSCKHPYNECLDWLKSTFDVLGIKKYEMVTEENLEEYSNKDVSEFGGIYIGGGNTPYLLKKLKESGVWKFLQDAVEKDIPIYGGSAGAIIFSKAITPSLNFDKNWVELNGKDLDGMNLTKDNFLFCHFNENKEDRIKQIILEQKTSPAILLPEPSGLSIVDDKITALGDVWVMDKEGNKKELSLI